MRGFRRTFLLLLALPLLARAVGMSPERSRGKNDPRNQDGVVAAKAPLCKRSPFPPIERLLAAVPPARTPWAASQIERTPELTRPLYLKNHLPANPESRRGPPA